MKGDEIALQNFAERSRFRQQRIVVCRAHTHTPEKAQQTRTDTARADHTDTVEDLTARGRDTESQVLARAVKWHSEHRVLLNGHKTVIFK